MSSHKAAAYKYEQRSVNDISVFQYRV